MDNITHTIAGLVLAEGAVRLHARRTGREPSPPFRIAAVASSVIAANLPDADLFYSGIGGDRLAYMLHHRGHTHTVVGAIVGAVLLWAAATLVWRWRARAAPAREEGSWLLGLLLASTLGHLALDWTNSYGVHPFWPVDNHWLYGDAVFIIEPWFWVVAVPALVLSSQRRVARVLLAMVLLGGLLAAWWIDLVAAGAALALTAGAVLSVAVARRLAPGPRVATVVVAWVMVTVVMATGSAAARAQVLSAVRMADPSAQVLDVVVTPLPANPLCASILTVERAGSDYRVMTARATGIPAMMNVRMCGAFERAGPMFGLSSRPSTPAVRWGREWTASAADLSALARESCSALAALRFIRVPVWRTLDDSTVMIGDVRYGGASGDGFSDLVVPRRTADCPSAIPPWIPPRADLLAWPSGLSHRIPSAE